MIKELWQRETQKGKFGYLCSIKSPQTYYYHEWDDVIDNDKGDEGRCIIKLNMLLHCFYDGDNKVYFLDSNGNVRMQSIYYSVEEFYGDYCFTPKGKRLNEPTIKKFVKNIKEWYCYEEES